MGALVANMSMSLDGFIADPHDGVEALFGWYGSGPVTTPTADPRWSFQTSEASAGVLREALTAAGALVCGRRLFDHTSGWGGRHPMGVPVVVVSHSVPAGWPREDAPFSFVTDGVAAAIAAAQALAGEKVVAVASASVARQCLDLGLLDEIRVDLVPVVLGAGIPFLAGSAGPVRLGNPQVVEGDGVTHLRYVVERT